MQETRDAGLIPELGGSPGEPGYLLQCSCLEHPINRGAWWATVHRVTALDTAEAAQLYPMCGTCCQNPAQPPHSKTQNLSPAEDIRNQDSGVLLAGEQMEEEADWSLGPGGETHS